jgi:hypothetical protein
MDDSKPPPRRGGWAASPSKAMPDVTARQRAEDALVAVTQMLEESGLGFDVYSPRGNRPKAAWGGGGAAEEVENDGGGEDAALPRPPTWFVHVDGANNPETALVSVGLTVNMLPAVGAIHDVASDSTYAARHGSTISVNGKPLDSPKSTPDLQTSPICTAICPPDLHEADAYVSSCCSATFLVVHPVTLCGCIVKAENRTYARPRAHAHPRTHIHPHTNAHTHTHITHTHAHLRIHSHAHTHIGTPIM